jgi:hypothetical protein
VAFSAEPFPSFSLVSSFFTAAIQVVSGAGPGPGETGQRCGTKKPGASILIIPGYLACLYAKTRKTPAQPFSYSPVFIAATGDGSGFRNTAL